MALHSADPIILRDRTAGIGPRRIRRGWKVAALVLVAGAVAYSCTDELPSGLPQAVAVRMFPDSADLRIGGTIKLQAVPVDELESYVTSVKVAWSTGDPSVATVDDTGVAMGTGSGNVTITATGSGIEGTARLRVRAAPSLVLSASEVGFEKVAGEADPAPQDITITNGGEFDLVGLAVGTITYGGGATGWLTAGLGGTSAPTTLAVGLDAMSLTDAGEYDATVTLTAPGASNGPFDLAVTLEVDPDEPVDAEATGDGQAASVGTTVAVPPSVRLTDQFGNPTPEVVVDFAVTGGGGNATGLSQVTDDDGIAAVGSWTLGTTPGANEITATPDAAGVAPVVFTAIGEPGAATGLELVDGQGLEATVGTNVGTPPSVRVVDGFGNPRPGTQVTFQVTGGGGTVSAASPTSDGNGVAQVGGWTLGVVAGQNTLEATAVGVPTAFEFTAEGTADGATNAWLDSGDGQLATVDTEVTLPPTILVTDQHGNPVDGFDVSFLVTGGGGSVTGANTATGADGLASPAGWTLGTMVGANTLQAIAAGLTGSPVPFVATGLADLPDEVAAFGGQGQAAVVATAVATAPSVRVTDQHGNPVEGIDVDWRVLTGGGSITDAATVTASNGVAQVGSWTLGPTVGANTLEAMAAPEGLTSNPIVFTATGTADASGPPPDADQSSVNATPGTITASGGSSLATVAVTVRDQFGSPLEFASVTLTVEPSGGVTVQQPVSSTNALGQTSGSFYAASVGDRTVTATVNGDVVLTETAMVAVDPGEPSAATSTVGSSVASITANDDDSSTATITVTVLDAFGNEIEGAEVTPGSTGSANVFAPTSGFSDSNGVIQFSYRSTVAQSKSLSASVTGLGSISQAAPVTVDPAAADLSNSLVSATDPITASQGSSPSTVVVTVRDEFGNPRSGHTVTLDVAGTGNTVTQPVGTTNASGQATGSFYSTDAGDKDVSADVEGVGAIQESPSVTVDPAPASLSNSLVSASGPIPASSGGSVSDVLVTVRDEFGNVRSGHTVTIAVSGTANTITQPVGATDAAGEAAGSFHSTKAEVKTVTATITSVGAIGVEPMVSVDASTPASVQVAGDAGSVRVGTALGSPPTFAVLDEFANPVPNTPVSYSTTGVGSFSGPATTDPSGMVTPNSWVVGGSEADDAVGRMLNEVTLTAGTAEGTATVYGIYTWALDATPLIGPGTACAGCHGLTASTVLEAPSTFEPCISYGGFRVVPGDAGSSILYSKMADATPVCGSQMTANYPGTTQFTANQLKIVRAWINNGAQDN